MNKFQKWFKKNLLKNKKNIILSCCFVAVAIAITAITGIEFRSFSKYNAYFYFDASENYVTGENYNEVRKFSDYSKSLKGTAGDADIFVMRGPDWKDPSTLGEGEVNGPSILVLGGTHPNEPSGQLTATVLLENIKPLGNTSVFIITETNRSAFTHSYPQDGSPFYYTLTTASGATRTFKFGSRATNTNEQWPNPDIYVHEYSGQKMSTSETRNLNRAYPGLENGTYTERVAFAITELIRSEDITITVDLHEASPEYLTINAIICHQRCVSLGASICDEVTDAMLVWDMENRLGEYTLNELFAKEIHKEGSPTNMHGLTHRELGDYTNTLAFLCETSNASQGKYRGAFTSELITYGDENPDYAGDPFYEKSVMLDDNNQSTKNGILYARPVTLSERVGRHAESIYHICELYNLNYENNSELFNNTEVETAKSLKTQEQVDALTALRTAQGPIEIDWSNLLEGYSVETEENCIYGNLITNKVGYYLHDPE